MTSPMAGADHILPDGWWAPGLALAERLAGARDRAHPERAREWIERWRAAYGTDGAFETRLTATGLDEAELVSLLAESPAALAERVRQPAWAGTVEQALHTAEPASAAMVRDLDWRAALALPLRPFVANATDHLADAAGQALRGDDADLRAIVERFADRLSRRLVDIAARTLAHELNTRLAGGLLEGANGRERFSHFVRQLTEPTGIAALLSSYPVLARLLGQASTFAAEANLELLTRFAVDRETLVNELLGGVDPGRLVAISSGLGDTHRRGRSVAVLTFADGRHVVYKPRDLGAHDRFTALANWLNRVVPGLDLRTAAAVLRDGYGWLEFIASLPVPTATAADRFYRRQGALLMLLHAAHSSDIHFENVIACGDQPVLVDVETVFHPGIAAPDETADPAVLALVDSVQRIGLLPAVTVGDNGAADLSGLGGAGGQPAPSTVTDWELAENGSLRHIRRSAELRGARNRPRLAGRDLDVVDHEQALLDGFRLAYDAITRHRDEFTELIEACADVEVRVVVRHTRGYAALLAESTRPELLRDALDRDHALDLLWAGSANHRLRWQVCQHEQADLWALDIPMFSTRPASVDLWSSAGRRLPGLLDKSGLASAMDKLRALGEVDRRDQEWIISAAVATRRPAGAHRSTQPMPGQLAGTAAPPDQLLAAACALADQIVARNLADGDRVNWLGLEFVDDRQWMVLPMGAGLVNGYLGVALFLAQLAELSGIARYCDMAHRAALAVPGTLQQLGNRADLVAAVGCGGFDGFGGIAYGLARLTVLLADDGMYDWTRTAVELSAVAARSPGAPGLAAGWAGCLATMTAVHAELGLAEAATLARRCADGLSDLAIRTGGRFGEGPTAAGFAHGAAGVGWALARYGGEPRHAEAARLALSGTGQAVRSTTEDGQIGWCSGAAGLAVAAAAADVTEPVGGLLGDRPVLQDLSLCHGELGIAEALTVFAAQGDQQVAAVRRRRAGLVLDALNQYGASCGVPGGMSTPGLLTGLAGIGYGLLRLGFAERVPSVLLFEPSRPTTHN